MNCSRRFFQLLGLPRPSAFGFLSAFGFRPSDFWLARAIDLEVLAALQPVLAHPA